jgi:tetratricopeptide (TPR) repeat protein
MLHDPAEELGRLFQQAAQLYQEGRFAEAIKPASCARDLARQRFGEDHPEYATGLDNLATLYQAMGDHASALPLYRQALEIYRVTLGEDHPNYAASLNNLAVLYHAMGDHASALPLFRKALEICRVALGEDHPRYAASLNNLAVLSVAMDREEDALVLMKQASAVDDRMIGQIFGIGSEQQRAAYISTLRAGNFAFLSLVLNHLNQSAVAVRSALDLVVRRKALRAEGEAAQRDAVLGGRYPHLTPRLKELQALRARIVQKTLSGPGPEGTQAHRQALAEWASQRDDLERDLARQIPEMNLERQLRSSDRRAVALGLPAGVALVEFVRFDVRDFKAVPARGESDWKPPHYVAFVLQGGDPDDVAMIDLGEAEPIDGLIAEFRAGILGNPERPTPRDMIKAGAVPARASHEQAGQALRAAVFDPMVPVLKEHSRLLLSPDGGLAFLPFEVLPCGDGRRLIDEYRISYLSCGRDVLRFGARSSGTPEAPLVMADPDFDLSGAQVDVGRAPTTSRPGIWSRLLGRKAARASRPEPNALAATAPVAPGRCSRDLRSASFHFDRLPGTRAEGDAIGRLLGVGPRLDAEALEGTLKAACHSPRILHLATHGFFLPDQPFDPDRERPGFLGDPGHESGRFRGPLPENPMLRSGLALAGANTWLSGGTPPEPAQDGLLTAEDVTGLDLLSTELVVLSACETGLGRVHVGEGVFGLRRAFVLAGAKTLVMSLWKVPDEQTRGLMEDFYRRLLSGQGRAEALREAQLALKAKYPDPFYWGAFICQGDPAPLPAPPAPGARG